MSITNNSKNVLPKASTKTSKNEIKRIKPNDIEQEVLYDQIDHYNSCINQIKTIEKSSNKSKEELKSIALETYFNEYKTSENNPGTIIIEAENVDGNIAEYKYVPSDRYISIKTQKQADEIESKLGKDIVSRETTYSFDSEMLEKYSDVISELIEETDLILEQDKSKLFIATEKYFVNKGTIDKLNKISEESESLLTIEDLFEGIKPVMSMKDTKIIKS